MTRSPLDIIADCFAEAEARESIQCMPAIPETEYPEETEDQFIERLLTTRRYAD